MDTYDVTILGGGLAGLCLARQLRIETPDASVAVVERVARPLPEAAHKVGESSVELGSRYFEHTLRLADYLRDRHLIKNGLRFFPGGGTTHALADRTEIGPPELPRVPSFQLDRGRLENDLRQMCEDDGVALFEGVSVAEVALGEPHAVTLSDGRTLQSRWVVDATGRRRMLARQLGLHKPSGHLAHAAWFRLEGELKVGDLVPTSDEEWHRRDPDDIRWLSTNHLMGEGYWVWIIPLSSGRTSIGVVVHGEKHAFDTIHTLERALTWIAEHEPALSPHLACFEVADFRCLKDYSYTAERVFSADRWALVGEAGLFVDPFYSPGSDFIALANAFTGQLIGAELAGEDIAERADYFDFFFRRLAHVSTATYVDAAEAYGEPRVLAAKIYWDNTNYWSFVCQFFFQELYRLPLEEQKKLLPVCERFASLNLRAQKMLSAWAKLAGDPVERDHVVHPPIPSMLANLHLDLEKQMSPEETLAYFVEKADAAEVVLTDLLLRAVTELGPERGRELVETVDARAWPLADLRDRVAAERGERRGRRKRLSKLARDIERTLGPVRGELLATASAVFGLSAEAPAATTAAS
ncbi:MAG: tryptophan 7-halogenase [Sandaracinaceae bacterium]|nr:tryptophan 7-halogenase [Sandaracinaceae bacterium]